MKGLFLIHTKMNLFKTLLFNIYSISRTYKTNQQSKEQISNKLKSI